MIDPPQGWMYGFPKSLESDQECSANIKIEEIITFLRSNGYPVDKYTAKDEPFFYRIWRKTLIDKQESNAPWGVSTIRKHLNGYLVDIHIKSGVALKEKTIFLATSIDQTQAYNVIVKNSDLGELVESDYGRSFDWGKIKIWMI